MTYINKNLLLIFGVSAVLSFSLASESHATISCVFSDGGKTVTITGEGNDTYGGDWSGFNCNSNNSSSSDSDWTFDSNYKETITTANIGSGVTSLGDKAFSGASSLTSVTLPNWWSCF